MPIELLPLVPDGTKRIPPNFEPFTIDRSPDIFPGLRNGNPKILDAGVVVFVCQAGTCDIIIDMQSVHLQKGSFAVLLPYTVIQILDYSEDIRITALTAGVDFLERLSLLQPVENYVALVQENPCLLLDEEKMEEVKDVYEFAQRRMEKAEGALAAEIRETLLTLLALEIVSLYASNKPAVRRKLSRQEQVFRHFTFSLAKNIRQYRNVEFYADEACLTPKHFSAVVKKKSGKLPTEWIAERTVLLIKFLLENSVMSIQEISNELNFPNQSFFSKYFKKHTGMTPKAYRNQKLAP